MAKTTIPVNLVPQVWAKKLWVEARKKIFFNKFAGKEVPTGDKTSQSSFNNIVVVSTDLTKSPGDTITIGLAYQLTGAGVSGVSPMEGNEEAINFYDFTVSLERYRNAILWDEIYEGQKSPYAMRQTAVQLLSDWLASKIDDLSITALTTNPTTNRILYGGDATSDATLDTADVFSTTLIERAVRKAKLASPKIRPVKVNGKEYYVILVHPYQLKALRNETAWREAQQSANIKGEDNPIFSGAEGVWGGAIIHEYDRIPTYNNWGANGNLNGARAVLLGAQALVHAYGKKSYWKERETDYDSKGVQVGTITGIAKTKFNNEDYGVIALDTYIEVD